MLTVTEKNPSAIRFIPDLLAFGITLLFAFYMQWETTDLLWSMWLSSLVLGYLTFFSAFGGAVYYVLAQREYLENRNLQDILIAVIGCLIFLAFFSFHFGAFHSAHASFLSSFFPLEGLDTQLKSLGLNPLDLWGFVFQNLIFPYAFFLVAVVIAEREHVFSHFLRGIRAGSGFRNAEKNDSNLLADVVLRPYINVIRMHFLIFFFAFCHYLNADDWFVFATVYAVYFFPWQSVHGLWKKIILIGAVLIIVSGVSFFTERGAEKDRGHKTHTSDAEVIARDGHFIAYSDATVLDTETGLMWSAADNGGNATWGSAVTYCRNYRGGGYRDWRMPTAEELKTLYDKNRGYPYGRQTRWTVHLTGLIHLSGPNIWSSDRKDSDAIRINFIYGTKNPTHPGGGSLRRGIAALPVRTHSDGRTHDTEPYLQIL
jgi:hypothetical protein